MESQKQPAASVVRDLLDARRQPRFQLEVDISIHSRTCGVLTGHTLDISESGVSALVNIEVPLGELVELEFTLPAGEVKIFAMVRQRNAFRYGFEFLGMDSEKEVILSTCRHLAAAQSTKAPFPT